MKYFKEGNIECGYSKDKGIIFGNNGEEVFSMAKKNGHIVFTEECDGYNSKELTKKQAVEMLEEAISWVFNGVSK